MSDTSWTDTIVGERMAVDQEFSSRVRNSRFSNQEWSLIMTATEFEIEHPDDPDQARIVANTEKVEQILPELENVRQQTGAMGGTAEGPDRSSGGGVVDTIKGALGMGEDDEDAYEAEREAAETLTQEYADELQSHLESKGRWETVREAATE
ncbi:DUF5799 family protein [Natrialbaceae archaeon AArc-T1-2]|uniref:DUF5799 family protein n=1 Tax=Natrialbaceae archaeon AArc-T1-2 TaxID=3053904 RepID=UPI00255ABDDB|nr:DUF5799 family protein [Natrialbaceae archaeon AArc-T1-2]WIV65957.1 DUF5799 family protein [Natrialbaceae archaeon AArc-T1-2]